MPPFITEHVPMESLEITDEKNNTNLLDSIQISETPLSDSQNTQTIHLNTQRDYFPPLDPSKPDAAEKPTFSQWLHLQKLQRPWWPMHESDNFRELYYKLRFNLDLSHHKASRLLCLAPQTVDKWLNGVRPPSALRANGVIITIINLLANPDKARQHLIMAGLHTDADGNEPAPFVPHAMQQQQNLNKPIKAKRD